MSNAHQQGAKSRLKDNSQMFKKNQMYTYTHFVLTAIFLGESGLAGCSLKSPSPSIPKLCILLGQA